MSEVNEVSLWPFPGNLLAEIKKLYYNYLCMYNYLYLYLDEYTEDYL
jgi:hypothetical protein